MIQMILMGLVGAFLHSAPVQTAGVKPCIWPNPCGGRRVEAVAQFKPCVFPNPCGGNKRQALFS